MKEMKDMQKIQIVSFIEKAELNYLDNNIVSRFY